MFDMLKVGRNIVKLRGAAGLTQMGLADKLGISYQAVSNWERGASMPDISKLPELGEIFNVSIEEILEEGRGTAILTSVLENATEDYLHQHEVSAIEILEVAPLLKTEQIEEVFEHVKANVPMGDLVALAPFLSDEVLDECARKVIEIGPISNLVALAPFLSEEVLDECARKVIEIGPIGDLVALAPFLSEEVLGECARKAFTEKDAGTLLQLAPFLNQEVLDECASRLYAK
ncbi:helix-turn-helix transcriptional regulator [Paenibacillus sp. FSL L8-0470]|uniref:helix-turn-helix domain-containing protein n=1 Tax=Paenibacillus sp. FSL L8-0470 TaxID=2954688 RepID=UPI0030FAD779